MKIPYWIRQFHPKYWVMNCSYSEMWDRKLNKLMSQNKFTYISEHRAMLGDTELWIENHPYASFTSPVGRVRPSRITIIKAYEKLLEDLLG